MFSNFDTNFNAILIVVRLIINYLNFYFKLLEYFLREKVINLFKNIK